MTESRELITISEAMTVGQVMAKSRYFTDASETAQAVVKILAGREMGFGPFAAMTGISIIKGKPVVGANLLAAAVKRSSRYDYKVITINDDACDIVFYQGGVELGHSIFTAKDAQEAEVGKLIAPGAQGTMIKRFPRNMLFSRAMSNGVHWYCPDVFSGAPAYTPGELDPPDISDVVDGTATVIETETESPSGDPPKEEPAVKAEKPQGKKAAEKPQRPLSPTQVKAYVEDLIKLSKDENGKAKADGNQVTILIQRLNEVEKGQATTVTKFLVDKAAADLSRDEASVILRWLVGKEGALSAASIAEAKAVIVAATPAPTAEKEEEAAA